MMGEIRRSKSGQLCIVHMSSRNLLLALLCLCSEEIAAKSVDGIFASNRAKESNGQYVSAFCFYGKGMSVNGGV